MTRVFKNEAGIKVEMSELKLLNGTTNYIISWNTNAIDRREYKTLKGAMKFLTNKGYKEM